ncbi:thermonuclease family protein [Thermogutta sp.]|uniref:thermonuclease family protein n=1 Tax=Thermogutta sp. TaxID=1962930 RepID=UPI003220622C
MNRRFPRFRIPRTGRRRRNVPDSRSLIFLLIIVILVVYRGLRSAHQNADRGPSTGEGVWMVEHVVDGDTLRLTNGETVRLIGVDAPESVKPHSPVEPFGPEAADYLATLVRQAGNQVRLEFDGPRRDKYGRLLAYVWAKDKLLNEEIIRAGFGRVEIQYSYSQIMKERFLLVEAEARIARRGIWSVSENVSPQK